MLQLPQQPDARILIASDINPDPTKPPSWFVSGMSQCGKTTVDLYIQSLMRRNVIIDTLKEYPGRGLEDLNSFRLFIAKYKNADFGNLIYRFPKGISAKEKDKTFNYICEGVMLLGNVHFTVEEVHKYCGPHYIPTAYSEIYTEGRHYLVSKTASSQRMAKVHGDVIGLSDTKVCGQLDEDNDIKKACTIFRSCQDNILALKRYEFLHKHNGVITSMNSDKLRLLNRSA